MLSFPSRVMGRFGVAAALGCGLLLGAAGASRAQSDSIAERYHTLITEGLKEFELGHYVEARGFFQQAHELKPNARTFRALGMTEYELRHHVRAVPLLQAALDDTRQPLTPEQRAEVRRLIDLAKSLIARYRVTVEPPDARLELDGTPVQLDDGVLKLDAGEHVLSVRAPGRVAETRRIDAAGGERQELHIELAPVPSPSETAGQADVQAAARQAATEAVAEYRDEGGSVFGTWWFWTITAVVASGATVGALWLTRGEEPEAPIPGTDGLQVMALELP